MVARQEDIFKAKEEELRVAVEKVKELEAKIKDQEEKMVTLSQEKNDLALALAAVSSHRLLLLFSFLSTPLTHLNLLWLSCQPRCVGSPVFHGRHIGYFTPDPLVSPQEQDTLGDAEERCTQLMHQKVHLEESVQVK